MKIRSLTLVNFKKFEKISLEFDEVNELHGANGVGKTSILEAIIVGYYGFLPDGKSGVDRLIQNGKDSCTIVIEDEDIGLITRVIKLKGQELQVDGKKISQDNFRTMYKLVPDEYFLASVNPSYWKDLDYKERRSIISDLTPKVDRNEVFKAMYPERLLEKFQIMTYTEVNSKVKSIISSIDNTKGAITQIKIDLRNPVKTDNTFDEKRYADLVKKKEAYKLLEPRIDEISRLEESKDLIKEVEEANSKKEEIEMQLKVLVKDYSFSDAEKDGVKLDIDAIRSIIEAKSKYIETIAKKNAEYDHSMVLYGKQGKAKENKLCEVCGRPLSDEEAHELKPQIDFIQLQKEIADLEDRLEKIELWEEELKDYDQKIQEYNSELKNIEFVLRSASSLNDILGRKEEIEKNKDKVLAEVDAIGWTYEADEELKNLEIEKAKLEGVNELQKKQNKELQNNLERYNSDLEAYEKELEDLEILKEALGPKGVESEIAVRKTKFIEQAVAKYSKDVVIETVEPLKSQDGYKEVFNVFKAGIVERKLSTGQRIVLAVGFCLAIQDLLASKLGYNAPILFIDDASLITTLTKIKSVSKGLQLFFCVNTDDTELKLIK